VPSSSVCPELQSLFDMAVSSEIGDGSSTLFWKDRWLHGQRIKDLAPLIFSMIPRRLVNRRLVTEALVDWSWVQDIHGAVSWELLQELFQLGNLLSVAGAA
jgi:hypothetical protein